MHRDDIQNPVLHAETEDLESTSLLSTIDPIHTDRLKTTGAPLERIDVLGREVTLLSAIMLNVGQITGSGIYAVPGAILNSVGSVGLLLIYWVLSPIFAFAGLSIYTELASMFPRRSGAEVVYLEQAYPRPRFMVSTGFAVTTILTSFSASNAVVFAQYTLAAFGQPITPHNQTLAAVSVILITAAGVALSTKWSLRAVNLLTIFKVLSLVFIVASGIAVLSGFTRIENPYANFHDPFKGSLWNLNGLATAFIKSNHAFIGYHNAFNVLGEVRGKNPVRTVRRAGIISLFLTMILFLFINIAYISAVPPEEIRRSGQLIAVLFFQNVFGSTGTKLFPLLVAASCFGNIIAVTIGQARIIREVARQGLLPYPGFFTSIKPFGTPIGPVALKAFLTVFVIIAVPAKDAFNFVLDLASYPHLIFQSAMSVGIWVLRRRRSASKIIPSAFQARNGVVVIYLTSCVLLLMLPWVPPEPGHADVSFWYATYCVAGLSVLGCCGLYYWLWIIVLPRFGGYEIVEEIQQHTNGATNMRLVRHYNRERQPLIQNISR